MSINNFKSWGVRFTPPPPPQVQQNETKGQKAAVDVSPPQVQQGRWYTFINEPGFYELVFSSKLKAAKKFCHWVFTTVLPSIRKYGYYKLFKDETRANQRVIIGGKHPVFTNYAASKNGEIVNVKTGKIKKMTNNGFGYLFFTLYDKKLEKPKNYSQHRFVYEVFKGVIPRCLEIDHINNIKTDNRIKNLQIISLYVSFISMFESTVINDVFPPPELSSTYFSVAASVLELGAPTFVSLFLFIS